MSKGRHADGRPDVDNGILIIPLSHFVVPMSSFEARIAKHIIRLQKTKAHQVTEQQRHAYYTAPGPLLHLLHNQAQRPANKERKETLTEKKTYEIPRKEACTSTEGVLPQRPEENTSKMPKEHACGGSLEADVQMRSEEEIEINKSLSEEGFRREIFEEQEEETLRQERLRRLPVVEEEDQRRYAAAELRRQEEERWYEELRQQEEEEEAQRRHEEQEVEEFQRQQEALRMRQEEEARRQQEELRKKKQDAQRQQHRDSREPKTRRFHPYMNTRDSGLERNEVTFIQISCVEMLIFLGFRKEPTPLEL